MLRVWLPLLCCSLAAGGLRRRAPGADCLLQSGGRTLDCTHLGLARPPNDDFDTVTALHLDFNSLRGLRKAELLSFPLLEVLTAARNVIESVDWDALQGVRQLRLLDLTGNQLLSVAAVWFPPGLSRLRLAANPLSAPPGPLLNASGLQRLSLEQCALAELPAAALAAAPALRELSLCYNSLRSLSLAGLPQLEQLFACANQLAELRLGPLPALRLLDLADNRLGAVDGSLWAGAGGVSDLILSGNPLQLAGPAPFGPLRAVRSLKLAGCGLAELGPEHLEPIEVELDLAGNRLAALGGLLAGQSRLRYLYLEGNNLSEVSAAELADCGRLDTLGLAENPLRRLELAAVAQLGQLQYLDISDTPLACGCGHSELAAWARERRVSLHDRCGGQRLCSFPRPAPEPPSTPSEPGPEQTAGPGGAGAGAGAGAPWLPPLRAAVAAWLARSANKMFY